MFKLIKKLWNNKYFIEGLMNSSMFTPDWGLDDKPAVKMVKKKRLSFTIKTNKTKIKQSKKIKKKKQKSFYDKPWNGRI